MDEKNDFTSNLAPPIDAQPPENEHEKLEVNVRPYRNSDGQPVRDLFYDSMSGEGSPFYLAMRAQWTKPISLFTYANIILGLAVVQSHRPVLRRIGYGIVFLALLTFCAYRYSLRATFEDYLRRNLEGDLSDVAEAYGIEVSPVEEHRSKPLASDASFTGKDGFWVAEIPGGEIIGCLGLDSKTHNCTETTSELRHLVVSRKYRRQGVAQKLVNSAVEHAKQNDIKSLFLTTSSYQRAALGLYQKLGWTQKEIRRVSVLFDNIDVYALSLDVQNYRF